MFLGGHLAADLSGLGDDVLDWAIRYGREDDVERIADRLDRRYPPAPPAEAAGAHTVEGQLADRAAVDEDLTLAADLDDWAHLALDFRGLDSLVGGPSANYAGRVHRADHRRPGRRGADCAALPQRPAEPAVRRLRMGARGGLVRAINAGATAGRSGDPVTAYPFPSGDLRRSVWVRGCAKTMRLPDEQHEQEQAAT
ncbi:Rmf/CrpP fold protein [Streptomyces yunnanensis]|uniref:Uncharacterized protein n=1 Tax=Streptomyces yunnanensis TaxID=156453 RepID=A0A9X8N615_9ACTN|nr:Rmf/CrpP fold protein [Streptomyces yunnanensis]SHN12473.1 hypothetical protein SAMN05216268_12082 [Streptomyces yunnanensis]